MSINISAVLVLPTPQDQRFVIIARHMGIEPSTLHLPFIITTCSVQRSEICSSEGINLRMVNINNQARMFALLVQLPLSDSISNLEAVVLEVVSHNFVGRNFDHTRLF